LLRGGFFALLGLFFLQAPRAAATEANRPSRGVRPICDAGVSEAMLTFSASGLPDGLRIDSTRGVAFATFNPGGATEGPPA
jgi:hypothetical protein